MAARIQGKFGGGPGGWGLQGMSGTGGGGLVRVPNLRVSKHLFPEGWHTQGWKDELTSCRGTVQSAWQKPPVRRKGGRAGLPTRVNGRHVVRGRQSSPSLEVRLGGQERLVKTVNIQVRWAAAQPGQDRRLLRGRHRLRHRPVALLRTESAQCTVRPT